MFSRSTLSTKQLFSFAEKASLQTNFAHNSSQLIQFWEENLTI